MNSSWLYRFYFYSQSRLHRFRKVGTSASKESCKSAIKKSKTSVRKRPSYFLFLSCCALAIATLLAMQSETKDSMQEMLIRTGWTEIPRPNCPSNGLFEVDGLADSAEVYISEETTLSSKTPMPEAPYTCRKINSPSLISEIL